MEQVMGIFERTYAVQLPVIDPDHHLVGYISRTRMYAVYRKMVADFSTD